MIAPRPDRFFTETTIKTALFFFASLPGIWLGLSYINTNLGSNPFSTLMQQSGLWSIIFLILTLLITPLRRWLTVLSRYYRWHFGKRLADWNMMIRIRRMLGLWSFFYACLHLLFYLTLEMDFLWEEIVFDVTSRNAIALGWLNWLILALLSITSLQRMRRKMGRYWRRLHRLSYILSLMVLLHVTMLVKANPWYFYVCLAVTLILLLDRWLVHIGILHHQKTDNGMESKRNK